MAGINPVNELWAEVERHPASLAPDGEERVRQLVVTGAARLVGEPERSDEALANLRRVLDRAAEISAERESDGEGDLAVLDVAVSEIGLELALRDLCPIFPFC